MLKYMCKKVNDLTSDIDDIYKELLEKKYQFIILYVNNKYMCLTKEKSLLDINDLDAFIEDCKGDIYYKSINEDLYEVNQKDLEKYYKYLSMFKDKLNKNIYGDKYLFGSVAVKVKNGFITTIRGKENLDDYAYVNYVDHINKIVSIKDKKASLNAPLLASLFENEKVDVIVHINHEYDESLEFCDYAFPGTYKDSNRDNSVSFNISNHGVFYLFDKEGEIMR